MRILFFTDTHIRGTTPRSRKDNLTDTLKNKFKEIEDIVQYKNVDYILHGGDWFDRPDISPAIVREFSMIIKNFGRPVYSVAGNHDLFGQNPDTVERTMLGLISGIGLIKLINYDEQIILEKEGIRVQLTGSSYNFDIDGDDYEKYYMVRKRKDVDYAVNIVHGMLLDRPFLQGIRYTLIKDIKSTEADITLSGHYHSGFGVKKLDSRYFINPGSLVRIANTLSEIRRKPQVVILDLQKEINIDCVVLKSALPGLEVMDTERLQEYDSKSEALQQFFNGIHNNTGMRKMDINSILEEIASNGSLEQEVRMEALERVARAREKVSAGVDEE